MAVLIRKMVPADLERALSLLAQYNMAPTPERADAERSGLSIENSFVAEDGGSIAGVASYIMLSDERAETASLAVDPAYRGQGLGARLQVARLREMKRRGVRWVRTESDRPETLAWYVRKFGYVEIGKNPKKHEFSLPDVAEWTVLELDLGALDLDSFGE
ncbi:MAG: GNAT family N-acetyltransferase [Gemmatimonadota bacterium]